MNHNSRKIKLVVMPRPITASVLNDELQVQEIIFNPENRGRLELRPTGKTTILAGRINGEEETITCHGNCSRFQKGDYCEIALSYAQQLLTIARHDKDLMVLGCTGMNPPDLRGGYIHVQFYSEQKP